jgi:hypothetical protein
MPYLSNFHTNKNQKLMADLVKLPANFQQKNGRVISGQNGMANQPGAEPKFGGQVRFSDQITFQATIAAAAATNLLVFNDSCGLNTSFGINTSANSAELTLTNGLTANNLRQYLQTWLPVIEWVNYQAVFTASGTADQDQLGNDPLITTCNLQRQSDDYLIAVKANQRNTQQQRDIQTYYPNGDLVITPETSIAITTASNALLEKKVSLTLKISKWISAAEYIRIMKNNVITSR